MITRHRFTSLLLLGSLLVAAPAFAQSDPSRQLSKLTADLSRLGEQLAQLSDLAELRALSALGDLPQLRDLPRIPDLDRLRDLPRLRELRDLSRRHALSALQAARQSRRSGSEQTERFRKVFRVGRDGSLYLVNVSGNIVIKAGIGDDIVVDATKRVRQGSDAQQQLNAVAIDATQRGSRVEVRTRYPERGGNYRASVDYTVTVPAGTGLDVTSISGDVQITDVKGSVRTDCTSGDVHIEGADQIEQVKTVSGDITVAGSAGTDVRVTNYSGNVTLRDVKARTLDVTTISGEARLTNVASERVAVKTTSGGVDYSGPFSRGGRYEFTAHSGDVRLAPTSATGFEIDARTFSGDVRSDLPLRLQSGDIPQRHVRRELKGTYGDGSALVTVHTFNGDVVIVKK
jgi:hypothetical protein